ncbi:MAG: Rieske (2Fe-2S) protein [Usitatibacter sp.]
MADDERLICRSEDLAEGGKGVRFALKAHPGEERGFAVRFGGKVHAYVNRCPHAWTELDWQPGEFFEEGGVYLICSTHGAMFVPDTGFCVAGPCRGASLEPLPVREHGGDVYLVNE